MSGSFSVGLYAEAGPRAEDAHPVLPDVFDAQFDYFFDYTYIKNKLRQGLLNRVS